MFPDDAANEYFPPVNRTVSLLTTTMSWNRLERPPQCGLKICGAAERATKFTTIGAQRKAARHTHTHTHDVYLPKLCWVHRQTPTPALQEHVANCEDYTNQISNLSALVVLTLKTKNGCVSPLRVLW